MFIDYFLKLSFAYAVVRFILYPYSLDETSASDQKAPPRQQKARRNGPFLRRIGGFALTTLLATVLLWPQLSWAMFFTLILFGAVSAFVTSAETFVPKRQWVGFLLAQGVQAILCAAVAGWWDTDGNLSEMQARATSALEGQPLLLLSVAYVVGVFGGSEATRSITAHFAAQVRSSRPGLKAAGRYIGVLERSLIITFVAADFKEAVGFLLAAKAVVRYPDIADGEGKFGEYFLVGTLTSAGIAIVVGLAVRALLAADPIHL